MGKTTDFIWMDGRFLPWAEANVHVMTHSIHYGTGIFEGINCYECKDGRSAIFKLEQHVRRLFKSASILGFIEIPFSLLEIKEAIIEIVKKNNIKEGYIRPIVIVGAGGIGPLPHGNPVHVAIAVMEPIIGYFGKDAIEKGVSVTVSSWRRDNRVMPFAAKAAGNYINSALVKLEAKKNGFDEGIVLDTRGHIDEGSAANIFIIRDGKLVTPPLSMPILKGITRDTVITLAQNELHLEVKETLFGPEDMYESDEAFFCGTAAEISPIRNIEERFIGKVCPGPITKKLQELYSGTVRGKIPKYKRWLTYVDFQKENPA